MQASASNYFNNLLEKLHTLYQSDHLAPAQNRVFDAFTLTPLNSMKGLLLGQDPYHHPSLASGLAFSVNRDQPVPPSLHTIYRELQQEFGYQRPTHGDLSYWASQGLLMTNSILTVKENLAASHKKIGWMTFTCHLLQYLNKQQPLFFFLWGQFAQSFIPYITNPNHCIIKAAHPSPLARNRFIGCNCFIKANQFLSDHSITEIDWQIP